MAYRTHHLFLATLAGLLLAASAHAGDIVVGMDAPDFTLKALSGANIRLKEQRGDRVLLGFWGTWCNNCPAALERLQRYADRYSANGLQVYAVTLDRDQDKIRHAVDDAELKIATLYDPFERIGARYEIESLPTWFLIDRDGKIVGIYRRFGNADLLPLDTQLEKERAP